MQVERSIESFISRKVREAGARGVVVGISGGVDSAVVAALCARALGKKRVTALVMPEMESTSKRTIKDAKKVARLLGIECYVIDFSSVYREFKGILPIFSEKALVADGNLRARIRMCILYYFANRRKLLVAGTGDRSELMMGYFTRYGDGGVDFLPIGRLYKTDVRKLALTLGIPLGIVEKKPSPGLWRGQTAEGELGMNYEKLDKILKGIGRKGDAALASELGVKESSIRRVRERIKLMEFKNRMPEVA